MFLVQNAVPSVVLPLSLQIPPILAFPIYDTRILINAGS